MMVESFSFLVLLRYALSIALLLALLVVIFVGVMWLRRGVYGSIGPGYTQALSLIAERLVLAAEQYYGSGQGQAKKRWVLEQVGLWAKRRHIPFDEELADSIVEAAVYVIINGPEGAKAKEVKGALQVMNAGGDPHALPFVKGEAPVVSGPPPVEVN